MDKKIPQLTESVGYLLQRLEDQLAGDREALTQIRFPRKFIRTRSYYEKSVWFLQSDNLRKNIAYTLQVNDVNLWVMTRFDLRGPAESLLVKQATITIVSILEAILQGVWTQERLGRTTHPRFQQLISATIKRFELPDTLEADLHAKRQFRNQVHFHTVREPEWNRYSLQDYRDAVATLYDLLHALSDAYQRLAP